MSAKRVYDLVREGEALKKLRKEMQVVVTSLYKEDALCAQIDEAAKKFSEKPLDSGIILSILNQSLNYLGEYEDVIENALRSFEVEWPPAVTQKKDI